MGPEHSDELAEEVCSIYRQHASGLLRFSRSFAPGGDRGHDAVQEVFLRYCAERRCGRRIEQPRAWLYQVLRNHLLELLQNERVRAIASRDIDFLPDGRPCPERTVAQWDMARKIALLLTRRELDCLHLRAEGLGYTQIAASIGIRPGTVGTLLTRARAKAHHFAMLQSKPTATAVESEKRFARTRPPGRSKSR